MARNAAERRELHHARSLRQRLLRQHRALPGAGRALLHDGRQPRQFDRQPRAAGARRCRLRAVREHRRPRPDHLLFDHGRRARLADLALAVVGSLEPVVHDRTMSRRRKRKIASAPAQPPESANGGKSIDLAVAAKTPPPETKAPKRRRRGGMPEFEDRIGYRFKNNGMLEQALTHISALAGGRNRSGSYQRLEFLGDHVLGLVISDMLFRAFPKADEGEMSRRLADLVRKEACADVARAIDLGTVI